jgi:hypothetical protein
MAGVEIRKHSLLAFCNELISNELESKLVRKNNSIDFSKRGMHRLGVQLPSFLPS